MNGKMIVDNDGVHPTRATDSAAVPLSTGALPLRLSYFQGPADEISLQLFYRGPGMTEFSIVPQSMLRTSR